MNVITVYHQISKFDRAQKWRGFIDLAAVTETHQIKFFKIFESRLRFESNKNRRIYVSAVLLCSGFRDNIGTSLLLFAFQK